MSGVEHQENRAEPREHEENPADTGRTSCLISSVNTRAANPAGAPDLSGELWQRYRQHLHIDFHSGAGEWLQQASPGSTAPPAGTWGNLTRCVFQGDTGGPLMCKVDGAWFQAAVLPRGNTSSSSSSRRRRSDTITFTSINNYSVFLKSTVGTFLSPQSNTTANTTSTTISPSSTTASSGAAALVPFLLHLLVFATSTLLLAS